MKLGLGFIFSPQIPDSSAKSPVELMRFLHVYVSSIQIVLANKRDLEFDRIRGNRKENQIHTHIPNVIPMEVAKVWNLFCIYPSNSSDGVNTFSVS